MIIPSNHKHFLIIILIILNFNLVFIIKRFLFSLINFHNNLIFIIIIYIIHFFNSNFINFTFIY